MNVQKYLIAIPCLFIFTACTPPPMLKDAKYWQRSDVSSAIYMRGPKAQEQLHQDIVDCTQEINELQRIGALRKATPADEKVDPSTPEGKMAAWDTPERDGSRYAEHSDYHDFETCMNAKGWERVENLPFELAAKARHDYRKNVLGEKFKSRHEYDQNGDAMPLQKRGDWDNLNE